MTSPEMAEELRQMAEQEQHDDIYFPHGGGQPRDYYEARLRYIVTDPARFQRLRQHAREIVLHHDRRRRFEGGSV